MRRSKRPQETGRRSQAQKKHRSKRFGLTVLLAVGIVVILGFLSFELWNRHVQKELIAERKALSAQAESKKWSREAKQLSEKEASLKKEQKEASIDAKVKQSLAKKKSSLAKEASKQEATRQSEASLAQSRSESLTKESSEREHDEETSSEKHPTDAFADLGAKVADYQALPTETVKKGTVIRWYNDCKANGHDVQFANSSEVDGIYNALDVCHTCKKYQLLTVTQ